MPYDPRQMQVIGRMGVGMMAPEPSPFQQPVPVPQPDPRHPRMERRDYGNPPVKTLPETEEERRRRILGSTDPPSLLDMMMGLGRMTRPEYDRAIREPGSYGVAPKDAARASPWAFLGSLGTSGGPR